MLKNMKVKKSLILGYGITIVISVALIIASLMMMNNQRGQYEMLMNEDVETNMAILNAQGQCHYGGRNYRDAPSGPRKQCQRKPDRAGGSGSGGDADLYQKPV